MSGSAIKSNTERALADVLSKRVIPDLVKGLDPSSTESQTMNRQAPFQFRESDMASVVHFVLLGNDKKTIELVDGFISEGCSLKDVYLKLFTDCARTLGDMWCKDECSFGDVTLGLAFLHSLLHHYREQLQFELARIDADASVLVASMPGETHIFGPSMLDVFFNGAGWQTDVFVEENEVSLVKKVSGSRYDLVCLSVTNREDVNVCRRLIRSIRARSINGEIKVLVGGNAILNNPAYVESVGADGTAEDALQCLELAYKICNLTKVRSVVSNVHNT